MVDTPITKKFYKKLELYLELRRQNKRVKKSPRGEKLWSMEKEFLLWALKGHWHMGTPLTPDYIKDRLLENGFNEKDFQGEYQENERQVSRNLVFKKFAYYPENQADSDTIQINNDGFLMGEVIEEAKSKKEYVYIIFIFFVWLSLILIFIEVVNKLMFYL